MGIYVPNAKGQLGLATSTANFSTTSTTAVLVSGLTVNVTIPAAGINGIKITVFGYNWYDSATNPGGVGYIYSGASSGALTTQIAAVEYANATGSEPFIIEYVGSPASGSIWYSAAVKTNNAANAMNITANSTAPAFILVEAI